MLDLLGLDAGYNASSTGLTDKALLCHTGPASIGTAAFLTPNTGKSACQSFGAATTASELQYESP